MMLIRLFVVAACFTPALVMADTFSVTGGTDDVGTCAATGTPRVCTTLRGALTTATDGTWFKSLGP